MAVSLPLILVIDGLDEAAPVGRWGAPFFPTRLPEGVYIVASVRHTAGDRVPPHLDQWFTQACKILPVRVLGREDVIEWMTKLGPQIQARSGDADVVDALMEKTAGVPLHLACLFEDFSANVFTTADLLKMIHGTPKGFGAYVELQFRRLVESPVGQDQRWQQFFGLLVAAKAELRAQDMETLIGLSAWDLSVIPAELHRWISHREDRYAFRSEALRAAFLKLNPWPDARERLLRYARNWRENQRPYALRSLVGHLRDANDRAAWLTVAADSLFLRMQGEAFPLEPLLPLQTIEDGMLEAIASGELKALCRLIFTHASWMPNPGSINPLEVAVIAPVLARQRIRLAETTDPTTRPAWQVLSAWRCAVEGQSEEARRFLAEITAVPGRPVRGSYCLQIVAETLPKLLSVDAVLTREVGMTLLAHVELPRFLGSILPAEEACRKTREWYGRSNSNSSSGWCALYRSLAESGASDPMLEGLRKWVPARYRPHVLIEIGEVLYKKGNAAVLQQCLELATEGRAEGTSNDPLDLKSEAILMAVAGALAMNRRESGGKSLFARAEAVLAVMPALLPHAPEALAHVARWRFESSHEAEAVAGFMKARSMVLETDGPAAIVAGTLTQIAQILFPLCDRSTAFREAAEGLLRELQHRALRKASGVLASNLPRAVAEGWDALGEENRAWEWMRKIPNRQIRGKAVASFVSRRLRRDRVAAAEGLLEPRRGGGFVRGWGLHRLGVYHLQRQEWDAAAAHFSRAVQEGAANGGPMNSIQSVLLLGELARAFSTLEDVPSARACAEAAHRRADKISGPVRLWHLLDLAERICGLSATDVGKRALSEATEAALDEQQDPLRVPLLCYVATVQHAVGDDGTAYKAIKRADEIILTQIPDPLEGTTKRCEVLVAMDKCGFDVRKRLRSLFEYAIARRAQPKRLAQEVIAAAALGHARTVQLEPAKCLLEELGDARFDAAERARATIAVYEGRFDEVEAAVSSMRIDGDRTRARRDLARILIALKQPEQALAMARRIEADRDNALPWIAERLAMDGFNAAFFELVIPTTRFPNAIPAILASLLRIRPALAPEMERLLEEFVPGLAPGERGP